MNRTVAWGVAFVASSIGAATMLYTATHEPRPAEKIAVRNAREVSDIDLQLIVGKIREGDLMALKRDLAGAKIAWEKARAMGQGLWPVHVGLGDSYARNAMAAEAEVEYAAAERLAAEVTPVAASALRCRRVFNLRQLKSDAAALELLIDFDHLQVPGPLVVALATDGAPLLKKADRDPRYWPIVYTVLMRAGDKAGAAKALAKTSILGAPWDANLAGAAVQFLRSEKLVDEAIAVCRAHAKAAPDDVAVWELMGDVLREAGRHDEALLAYASMAALRPGDAATHRRLGVILRELKKYSEAISQFEQVDKLRPEEPDGLREIAETRTAMGDTDGALRLFEAILAKKWEARFGDVMAQMRVPIAAAYRKKIESATGDEKASIRKRAADLGIIELGLFDVKITMTWDTATDVDLYVTDPKGETVSYNKRTSASGAVYFIDDRDGFGPETYVLAKGPAGNYKIEAHYCGGSGRTTVRLTVVLRQGTAQEETRHETLVLEKQGERKAIAEAVVR